MQVSATTSHSGEDLVGSVKIEEGEAGEVGASGDGTVVQVGVTARPRRLVASRSIQQFDDAGAVMLSSTQVRAGRVSTSSAATRRRWFG